MKKVFIDLGFNKGQSVKFFYDLIPDSDEYEIYAFEPDPSNFKSFENFNDVNFYKKAAWIYDGVVKFYLGSESFASTINSSKITNIKQDRFIETDCLDICKFIMDNFDKDDYIILKIDIEGAEYELLNYMLSNDCLEYINDLFVEFHLGKITNITNDQHNDLINKLHSLGFAHADVAWEKENIKLNLITLYANN
jgi:FkbM family methyltransferase